MKKKVRDTVYDMGIEHVTVEVDFASEENKGDCF
jgi:hypothetical protein